MGFHIWGGGQGGRPLPPPAPIPPPPAPSSPSSLLERRALRARKIFLFFPPSLFSSPLPPPAPSSPSSLPLFSPLPPPLLPPPSYPVRPLIHTGQQKKGYKVICLLFYKTEWHVLFAYCKHNLCCFRVDLPNLNQVQWSETSARQFEWFCMTCTISKLLGTMEAK